MRARTRLIGFGLVIVLLLIATLGLVYQRSQISDLTSTLSAAHVERATLSAAVQLAQDQAAAANVQATAAAAQVSSLQAQLNDNSTAQVTWRAETLSFSSEYDRAAQSYLLITPLARAAAKYTLVVYLHSMGNGPDEVTKYQAGRESLVAYLLRRDVIVASPVYRGDSWLNAPALSDVTQMIRLLKTRFPIGPIVLAGFSMGGSAAVMYPLLAPKDIVVNGVVAAVSTSDVIDLWNETPNAQVKASLQAAYGGTPSDQPQVYNDRAVLRNILRFPANIPVALYAASNDSMIPSKEQIRLRDALAAHGNPLLFALLPGDHHVDGLDEGFAFVLNRVGVP